MTSFDSSSRGPSMASESTTTLLINNASNRPELADPFADHFGTVNQFGETVLYESIGEIVRIAIFAYANYDESCEPIGPGKITIMFYPEIGEIRVILQSLNDIWPLRNAIINERQKFDYVGWLWRDDGRNRMCRSRQDLGPCERERGYIFGDWNYYGVAFGTEDEIFELNNAIRCIQTRMADGRGPETINDLPDASNLGISRFWCDTGLRMSEITIVCIHTGSVWRINGSYSVEHDKNGMIAITSKKQTPDVLEMLVMFQCRNRDDVNDVKKCYRIPATMSFVASHIAPVNKDDLVFEWAIGGDLWACAFRTSEDARTFKKIVELYVGQLKKASKKFFARK